jgi:hypothetical protein
MQSEKMSIVTITSKLTVSASQYQYDDAQRSRYRLSTISHSVSRFQRPEAVSKIQNSSEKIVDTLSEMWITNAMLCDIKGAQDAEVTTGRLVEIYA